MDKRIIRKIARESLRLGPVVTTDINGHEYFAYEIYLRSRFKSCLLHIDEAIVDLNKEHSVDFFATEIKAALEGMGALSCQ